MFMSSELVKRVNRMQDAVNKGAFQLVDHYTARYNGQTIHVYELRSWHTHRRSPRLYTIVREGSTWHCSCPDFEQNGAYYPCKHILYITILRPEDY